MSKIRVNRSAKARVPALILCIVAAVLLAAAAVGYVLRTNDSTAANLTAMRDRAVVHAASDGLVESIAQQARADKLAELRKRSDFRRMGLNEVNETCDAAAQEAREAAQKLYSDPTVSDPEALSTAIDALEEALEQVGTLSESERATYSELYVSLVDSVPDWTDLSDSAADDDALIEALAAYVPELAGEENAHLKDSFVKLVRDRAEEEKEEDAAELLEQLTASLRRTRSATGPNTRSRVTMSSGRV